MIYIGLLDQNKREITGGGYGRVLLTQAKYDDDRHCYMVSFQALERWSPVYNACIIVDNKVYPLLLTHTHLCLAAYDELKLEVPLKALVQSLTLPLGFNPYLVRPSLEE